MFSEEGTGRFLSSRVRDIRPSGIRAFFDLNAASGDTIALGVGEPDFVTPEKVREACIQVLREGQTKYTSNAGLMELREELSAYFASSFAIPYDPEQEIIVTVGSSEAVDLALRAVIDPGDEVLIPAPSYIAYEPIIHLHGGKIMEVAATAGAVQADPASAASSNYASFKGFNDQLSVQSDRNSYDRAGLAADCRAHYQT